MDIKEIRALEVMDEVTDNLTEIDRRYKRIQRRMIANLGQLIIFFVVGIIALSWWLWM